MTEDRDRERLNSSNVEGDEAWQGSAGTVGRYHAMESLISTVLNIPAAGSGQALAWVVRDTHPPNLMVYPNAVMRVPEIDSDDDEEEGKLLSVTERSTEDEEDEEDEEASSSNDSEGRGAHEAVPPALQRKRKAAGTTMTRKCVISGAVTKVKGKKVTALKPAKSLKPAAPKASGVEAAAEVKKPRKRKASPVLEEPALEELPPRKRTKTAKAADGLLHVCTDEGKTPYSKRNENSDIPGYEKMKETSDLRHGDENGNGLNHPIQSFLDEAIYFPTRYLESLSRDYFNPY
ncbi:hypothetical protein MMC12_007274 [Toensbergia leucococca]|nr:hypothetical protein [Toensbergia leucococca]